MRQLREGPTGHPDAMTSGDKRRSRARPSPRRQRGGDGDRNHSDEGTGDRRDLGAALIWRRARRQPTPGGAAATQLVTVTASAYGTRPHRSTSGSAAAIAGSRRGPVAPGSAAAGSTHKREGDARHPWGRIAWAPPPMASRRTPACTALPPAVCGDWWTRMPRRRQQVPARRSRRAPSFGGGSEALWRISPQYRYFAVVEYNVRLTARSRLRDLPPRQRRAADRWVREPPEAQPRPALAATVGETADPPRIYARGVRRALEPVVRDRLTPPRTRRTHGTPEPGSPSKVASRTLSPRGSPGRGSRARRRNSSRSILLPSGGWYARKPSLRDAERPGARRPARGRRGPALAARAVAVADGERPAVTSAHFTAEATAGQREVGHSMRIMRACAPPQSRLRRAGGRRASPPGSGSRSRRITSRRRSRSCSTF